MFIKTNATASESRYAVMLDAELSGMLLLWLTIYTGKHDAVEWLPY